MTRQEMFDKAAVGLLRQGKRSLGSTGGCAYLSSEGYRCAVGFLIPEGHAGLHHKDFVHVLLQDYPDLKKFLIDPAFDRTQGLKFLEELQSIHDLCQPDDWKRHLTEFALTYSLNTGVLQEF